MPQARPSDALKAWLDAQRARGVGDPSLKAAMLERGWGPDAADQALRGGEVAEPHAGPSVAEADGAHVWAHDRWLTVRLRLQSPRLALIDGVLTQEECVELMAQATPRLRRSETVSAHSGTAEVNHARTSEGMFFQRAASPLIAQLEARLAALCQWPEDHGEGLQVLRYGVGGEYRPHQDYFDARQAGTASLLRRGGQRVATVIVYLKAPAAGGATVFPDAGLEVPPQAGQAVFFAYPQASASCRALHGGKPVMSGEKWIATKWLRAQPFV